MKNIPGTREYHDAQPVVTRPDKCPECGSKAVGTLAKEITDATLLAVPSVRQWVEP